MSVIRHQTDLFVVQLRRSRSIDGAGSVAIALAGLDEPLASANLARVVSRAG